MKILSKKKISLINESVVRRCSVKKMLLKLSQNSQENTCAGVSFLIRLQASACNLIKKKTLSQVFSCKFCEISKNTFFYRTPSVAVSSIFLGQLLIILLTSDRETRQFGGQLDITYYHSFGGNNVSL